VRRTKRRYTDHDRADALAWLAGNAGNVARTARELRVPRATLQAWAEGSRHPEAAEHAAPKKAALADLFEHLARESLGLAGERMATASFAQLVLAACQAADKMRLLRGEATAINEFDLSRLSDEELARRIEELHREIAAQEGPLGLRRPRSGQGGGGADAAPA
jgi:hypothetical protein